MLQVLDKNLVTVGVLPDAIEVVRKRRLNSDYELSFSLPMISDDYDKVQPKGHVKDERGQLYVINDRSRKRDGKKRMVQFDCMHVMFKMSDFKFPYASYIDEAYGINIVTLLNSISAATNGKFTFNVDPGFDLKDVKDFGRGNTLEALNYVSDKYGAEIEPDNFVIHVKKTVGMDRGLQYRLRKNIINIHFNDKSRALTTRLFSQMKDGRTFIGLAASNLTTEEYALLNDIPGAIVGGIIRVNYLISPYAAYWSNTTNTYFDNELIDQDIEDPLELLLATRKSLRVQEVPALDVSVSVADLHKIDPDEEQAYIGDTVLLYDEEMQIKGIQARVMEINEYPFNRDKQPDVKLANFYLRDDYDILADFNKSKQLVESIVSGGKVRTAAFETFAAQAITDINNSKSQVIYDQRGIVLQSLVNPLHQVVASSVGIYITRDGGVTADAALTSAGLVAEKVYGKLGNFIEIEIGIGNNVFKANQNGIHLGHQTFASSPFRVNMAGQLFATQADITGMIHAKGGSFEGDITASGTITGGTIIGATLTGGVITGALIQTKVEGQFPRSVMSTTENMFGVYTDASNYVLFQNYGGAPAFRFVTAGTQRALINTLLGYLEIFGDNGVYINAANGAANITLAANNVIMPSWSSVVNGTSGQTLQEAFLTKAQKGIPTGSGGAHNHGIPSGTRLATTDSSGAVTGFVTYSAAGTHTHEQL
ncbi:prophage endopeptidase tail family protein [Paenibacillus sp. BIHB 4019]|nr:prophage endopeptidase tail family protein [Paenibacillus sp. BIHB 4019]